jgi:hypothetical protein
MRFDTFGDGPVGLGGPPELSRGVNMGRAPEPPEDGVDEVVPGARFFSVIPPIFSLAGAFGGTEAAT